MKKLIVATLLLGSGTLLSAQKTAKIKNQKESNSIDSHCRWCSCTSHYCDCILQSKQKRYEIQ